MLHLPTADVHLDLTGVDARAPEWHDARRAGIGSSDAPVITGHDSYRTPWELYLTKRGELPGAIRTDLVERREHVFTLASL